MITINHSDRSVRDKASDWLYANQDVRGNEDVLLGEKITGAMTNQDIWKLENSLSLWFGVTVEMPKDARFIEFK